MDRISKEQRSELMSKIRSESNIEILPNNLIGLYLRKHQKNILGNPDFSNKSRKIAVFIDGCFWHHCPIHGKFPKSNRKYWIPKLKENKKRDRKTTRKLLNGGWKVIRIWEHQLKLNRNCIGIEKEEEYVKIANARIKPFLEQSKLK